MAEHTKGKLHRHGLTIDIKKADGDHTILATMNESSTAYLPVYEQQAANAAELVRRWNAFEGLLAACETALGGLTLFFVPQGAKIGSKVSVPPEIKRMFDELEAEITAARKD